MYIYYSSCWTRSAHGKAGDAGLKRPQGPRLMSVLGLAAGRCRSTATTECESWTVTWILSRRCAVDVTHRFRPLRGSPNGLLVHADSSVLRVN